MSTEAEILLAKLIEKGIPAYQWKPPHDSCVATECDVRIKRLSDGKEVIYKEDMLWSDDYNELELSTFIWSDGNYSCTCNRGTFFDRACGVPEDEIPDYKCGDGDYFVEIKDWRGEVIYSDFPTENS